MKRVLTVIILSTLMISGCAMISHDNGDLKSEESSNKSESVITTDESVSDSDFAEDNERSFSKPHPNFDLYLELDLEDGKFYEIPRLSKEKEEEFIQANDCAESIRTRLESYGVLFNPFVMGEDRYSSDVEYSFLPMFIGHYGNFDLLYVRYSGYRGTNSGNLYIFEKSMFKSAIFHIGEIDLANCFRAIEENIWFVVTRYIGGSGMGGQIQEWRTLTGENVSIALKYANYYGTNNYKFGLDHDPGVYPELCYSASEEELYINEQNIPILRVKWQKEVYVQKEVSDEEKAISLITDGYDDYAIDASIDWETFPWSSPISGKLLDGFEEQLDRLIKHGTEEEKNAAQQLVDNYITMPSS